MVEDNRFLLLIQEMSSAVMFCNTILSKFQSESVLSDCVFACETVEMVIRPGNCSVQIICPSILVSVAK